MWCCVVLAFRSLLRKSNLLPSNELHLHCVRRQDITFMSWGMMVSVLSSKTIQFWERMLEIPIVKSARSPLCAVTLLQEHFRRTSSASPHDNLFIVPRKGGLVPLEYPFIFRNSNHGLQQYALLMMLGSTPYVVAQPRT